MKKENEKLEQEEISEKEEEKQEEIKENSSKEEVIQNSNEEIASEKEVEKKEKVEEQEEQSEEKLEKPVQDEKKEEIIEEKDHTVPEPKETEKKDKKSIRGKIILCFILIIFVLFLSTIFAIMNVNNQNVIKGVYIENIEVSGFNKEEVNLLVNQRIDAIEEIELVGEDYETIVKLEDIGAVINGKDAIKESIEIGKTNNILIDNFNILKTRILKTKLNIGIEINEQKLKEMIKNIQAEMPGAVKEYSYEIKKDELIITNGKEGLTVDEGQLKKEIIENIQKQFNGEINTIELPTKQAEATAIDIEKIYNEIHKEAKDAYIVDEPFELHKEEEGVDFKNSIEEVKEMLQEKKETYKIPLKITEPRIKVKDLGSKLFKQTLSKYTTIYDSSNTNRASNIALAAKTINGTILLPGETFSYNGTLGNTTKEKGYKPGGAYVGGKVVQTYGGGICQVSTTLYNAVLYANLEIVERHNHSYTVTYVPAGRDATVSYGGKDFKFKNSRTYPIQIAANAKNGVVSISIKGIKEEKEYEIELTSKVLSTTPATTVFEKTSSLAEGKQKVIQVGHTGQKSIAYKIVKYNGKVISKTVLSKDTYKPMNRIVQVGTKTTTPKATNSTVPTNTTPAPSQTTVPTSSSNVATTQTNV